MCDAASLSIMHDMLRSSLKTTYYSRKTILALNKRRTMHYKCINVTFALVRRIRALLKDITSVCFSVKFDYF